MRLTDFLEKIASKTPTPGGGSVSAAVGAMGAALGVMTARYSDASDPEHDLDALKDEFLKLVDLDAEAYGQVNSAMALPKTDDDTKRRRKEALQIALGDAAEVLPTVGTTILVIFSVFGVLGITPEIYIGLVLLSALVQGMIISYVYVRRPRMYEQ